MGTVKYTNNAAQLLLLDQKRSCGDMPFDHQMMQKRSRCNKQPFSLTLQPSPKKRETLELFDYDEQVDEFTQNANEQARPSSRNILPIFGGRKNSPLKITNLPGTKTQTM